MKKSFFVKAMAIFIIAAVLLITRITIVYAEDLSLPTVEIPETIEELAEIVPDEAMKGDFTDIVQQINDYFCGPAALTTVFQSMGWSTLTQEEIATLAGTDENGTSLSGLKKAVEMLGYYGLIKRLGSVEELSTITDPIILYLADEDGHYVVFKKINSDQIELADPEEGNVTKSIDEFQQEWKGRVLIISQQQFAENDDQESLDFKGKGGWLRLVTAAMKNINKFFRNFGSLETHHLLPQQFASTFERLGIKIEEFTVRLPKWLHRLIPWGVHTGSENWNTQWQKFLEQNPTKQEVYKKLYEMMNNSFMIL